MSRNRAAARVAGCRRPGAAVLALLLASVVLPVRAQMFTYGAEPDRPQQAWFLSVAPVRFVYDGEGEPPTVTYAFDAPVYGLWYTRPGLDLGVALGTSGSPPADSLDRDLLDVSLLSWGEFRLTRGREAERRRLFIPVGIHSQHRRVTRDRGVFSSGSADDFSVTTLGIGAGLGFSGEPARRLWLDARVMPVLGLATRSFGDATGSARVVDADVQLHLGSLAGRFGLSVGYNYRAQWWRVDASDLLRAGVGNDLFHYRGTQHALRLGVNW